MPLENGDLSINKSYGFKERLENCAIQGIMLMVLLLLRSLTSVSCLPPDIVKMTAEYYTHTHQDVKHLSYFSCESVRQNTNLVKHLMVSNIRVSVVRTYKDLLLEKVLRQWDGAVGVLLDGACNITQEVLNLASKTRLFDAMHVWLIININNYTYVDELFRPINLSVDADIAVASIEGDHYKLTDVFNFGKIQGNNLEINLLATWSRETGLNISLKGFKYYNRWNFHNLTLRAVSVILEQPAVFVPSLLTDVRYLSGVSAMTKIVAQLLQVLREQHNFRFNYTIADRWVGSPERNSTLSVTNSLYWREQDISCTCLRILPNWLDWMDPFFPPATQLETKFYYLIPDKGVGEYENRFLSPMSEGVWRCACAAGGICIIALAVAAHIEGRPQPTLYAVFSVSAAVCQQAYEDGVQILEEVYSSQGRRLIILVVGLTSMLLYNYYTSSVVSWLLSAAAPTIATLDGLIKSDLKLIFEDIGYSRSWLDNVGTYYFSGFKNTKEDELREKKVTKAKRMVSLMQPVSDGIELMRTGEYAYHSEPYTASRVISRRLTDRELCELGTLQMMMPSHVYVMGQKRSPYKQFFVWSLMRLQERGHMKASRTRIVGHVPTCSGSIPRALALGQAAPAFALLASATILAVLILLLELAWHRYGGRR